MLVARSIALVIDPRPVALADFTARGLAASSIGVIEGGSTTPPPIGGLISRIEAAWPVPGVGRPIGRTVGAVARGTGTVIGARLVSVSIIELPRRDFAQQTDAIETIAKALPGTNAGCLAGSFAESTAPEVNQLVGWGQAGVVLGMWPVVSPLGVFGDFARRGGTS